MMMVVRKKKYNGWIIGKKALEINEVRHVFDVSIHQLLKGTANRPRKATRSGSNFNR